MEGEEDQNNTPDDNNINNKFEALMIRMDSPPESSAFFTKINLINPSDTRNMAINLSNNVMSHILLKD